MTNATQLSLENPKRFSKRTTITILIMAPLLGLLFAYILTLAPNELETKALELLDNQKAWWVEQEKIVNYESQIEALEALKLESMNVQNELHGESEEIRMSITGSLSGF